MGVHHLIPAFTAFAPCLLCIITIHTNKLSVPHFTRTVDALHPAQHPAHTTPSAPPFRTLTMPID